MCKSNLDILIRNEEIKDLYEEIKRSYTQMQTYSEILSVDMK